MVETIGFPVTANQSSAGDYLPIDSDTLAGCTVTNSSAYAVEYSTGGAWTTISAGGSATINTGAIATTSLRFRKKTGDGIPVVLSVAVTHPGTTPAQLATDAAGSTVWPGSGGGVVVIGDSRTEQNTNTARTNKNAQGVLTWAQALSRKQAFWSGAAINNFGKSGDRTDQMLDRVPSLVASTAAVAVVWGGVNDIAQQYPTATTSGATAFANIQTIVNAALASGKKVVVVLDTPVTSWSAAQRGQLLILNNLLLRAYSGKSNVQLADFFRAIIDPASATMQPLANYYSDATHIGIKGAYFCGKLLQSIVDPMLPGGLLPLSFGVYDNYANNPTGNLLDNGCFTTTSGGTVSTGASGTAPSGVTVSRQSGTGTVAVSTAASPDGVGNDLVLTLSGVANDVFNASMDVSSPAARVTPGTTYVLEAEIQVTSGTGLRAPKIYLEYNGSISGTKQSIVFEDTVGGSGGDEDFIARIQTEPYTVPVNGETINWVTARFRPSCNAACSAVIKLRQVRIRPTS